MSHSPIPPPREEVLADTQETLRAVANTLEALGAPAEGSEGDIRTSSPLQRLAQFLAESYGELAGILDGLRQTRSLFRKVEVDSLQRTHLTLKEVTEQTETATTDMLDGLERCLVLVDSLTASPDEIDEGAEFDHTTRNVQDGLRDELHLVMQHLQFQDITSQRIGHASRVLTDVEQRLLSLVKTLEHCGFAEEGFVDSEEEQLVPKENEVHDPDATLAGSDARQALADDIFT